MKKRTDSDFVKQGIKSRKWLNAVQHPRKFNIRKFRATSKRVLDRVIVPAPNSLSVFNEQYDDFAKFLKTLEREAAKGRVLIDLKNVRFVKVSGVLILYANIEQLQKKHQDRSLIKTTGGTSKEVSMFFRTFGIWNLTGESRTRSPKKFVDSIEICTMPHKAFAPEHHKKQLRKVLTYTQQAIKKVEIHEGALLAYNAITESISNVWQHAYDDTFFEQPVPLQLRNWWIIVQYIDGQFFIAMYDMGASIPVTISTKSWAPALIDTISKLLEMTGGKVFASGDAKSIKAAVDYGKSRFKKDNRGKGLTEAKDFVQRNPKGSMLIYSGLGHYEYKTEGDKENLETLSTPLKGTLIQWNLMLEKKNEAR